MIKLTRIRTKTAIASGLRGAGREKKNLDLLTLKQMTTGELASKAFKSSLWKPAKKQLKIEANNKCAYCEADTSVVAHGDVEHFRPKTRYWWLAYCYDNYLYSCQLCNQTFKSNHFPISGRKISGPRVTKNTSAAQLKRLAKTMYPDPFEPSVAAARKSFLKKLARERADLIDPYQFDPADLLVWTADDDRKEVTVEIKPRVKDRAARQDALVRRYGLNREELRKVRFVDYTNAKVLGEAIPALGNHPLVATIKVQLKSLMAPQHRFAGMIRYFVVKKWKLDLD